MVENKDMVVDQETGEIKANTEKKDERRPENLRVVKVLLLGAKYYEGDVKKKKDPGMSLLFVDAVETDQHTGQPVLRGFNPVINCYVKNPTVEVQALQAEPVFTVKFIKISGNDDFIQFHGILTDAEIALYRQLMGDLFNKI